MLLIYVSKLTNRVGYTLNLIFKNILHIPFEITLDEDYYTTFDGCKLCYSDKKIGDGLYIKSVKLLYQTSIENQEIQMSEYNDLPIFFATYAKEQTLPFDIFAASFYLVSRYEEYLPHHKDYHQRFDFKDSLAYQKGFLHVPLVNKWANLLANKLKEAYPDFVIPLRKFHFVNTIDVDSAYSFKQKGVFRNVGGFIRDIFKQDYESVKMRAMVMLNRRKDPFDTFDFILSTSEKYHTELLFFILFADYDNYDKNISYNSLYFQQLIKHLADYSKVGIHPSYASMEQPQKLTAEIKRLSKVLHKPIVRSRFHFLRFQLPTTYNNLIKNNKANLLQSMQDLYYMMGWKKNEKVEVQQSILFDELPPDQKKVYDLLLLHKELTMDEIVEKSGLSLPKVATILLTLELKNVLKCLPGKIYKLM